VAGEIIGALQMIERSLDLARTIFVDSVTIEIGDDNTMHRRRI
jgi:hypothetical protein